MMNKNNTNEKQPDGTTQTAREKYLSRMRDRIQDVNWDDEESRYNAYLNFDDEQEQNLTKFRDSNKKLAEIFSQNPKFAALMRDVLKGDDPSVTFIRYFGEDALNATGDTEKIKLITEANKEYLNRVAESDKLRKTQETNLQKSEAEMTAFQSEKGLTDEQFAKFIDEIYNVMQNGLEGLITKDFMSIFWQGMNYEQDLHDAAQIGRTEGRNDKIKMENRIGKGDNIPNFQNASGTGTPAIPSKKRRSFYADGPGYTGE